MNYKSGILIFVYLFLICGIITIFQGDMQLNRVYSSLVLFFFLKAVFNYRKCTISYFECKLRNVKKEDGYLYTFIDSIVNLRDSVDIIPIYLMSGIIIAEYFVFNKN